MKPHNIANIAMDLAINSIIFANAKVSPTEQDNNVLPLPSICLIPGRALYHLKKGEKLTKEVKDAQPLAALIEKMPQLLSTEEYFMILHQNKDKLESDKCPNCGKSKNQSCGNDNQDSSSSSQGDQSDQDEGDQDNSNGQGGDQEGGGDSCRCPHCGASQGDSFDDHSMWDELSDEEKEYVKSRVQNIVEKAVNAADSKNGWGNIPADLAGDIRRSVSNVIPWRNILNQFVGSTLPGDRSTSIKKINRKFPYIHPGIKKNLRPKLLIAIDQSGSVSDEMLGIFFGELTNLAKLCDIWVLPFDCHADAKDIYKWRKGSQVPKGRTKAGGTDFNAPTEVANSPSQRGLWDAMLIVTDGECSAPKASRVRRGWVLGQGCKLHFQTHEPQIFVDKNKPLSGMWR
jgi:predicted metal-dependent peptidase